MLGNAGSQEVQPAVENVDLCSNHEDREARPDQIKLTKGFPAKEPVKGHMVNVVKGLKLYEDVFTDSELCKLNDFVNELRAAGQNGELPGEGQQERADSVWGSNFWANKRGSGKQQSNKPYRANSSSSPRCHRSLSAVATNSRVQKTNGCIINFFEEGEYSQPFLKPPHLDQPISTLLLSESTMAFGRTLVSDNDGNYKGPLMFSLKEGSLLVMRGNSADMARHVMCPSPNKRTSITLFRVQSMPVPNQSFQDWCQDSLAARRSKPICSPKWSSQWL
nr:hypothetical protein CFP56_59017 [Quercus suber]